MTLAGHVAISRRYQRSARIDTDLASLAAIEGFVCPASSADVLSSMARHVMDTKQGAFTWTGPYGSGKSSLAIVLAGLLNGHGPCREAADRILGKKLSTQLANAFPPGAKGWRIMPILGRRADPAHVIASALQAQDLFAIPSSGRIDPDRVLDAIREAAIQKPKQHGGLLIVVDEMGKFLEAAAQDKADVYFFQRLAEEASRSNGRLIVIGILHQAIDQYAHHVSQDMRDEWAKIQGRFVDLPVNTAPDEQLDLIARAITTDKTPKVPTNEAGAIAGLLGGYRGSPLAVTSRRLNQCWPLHPVVACMLGPISRRRFGQNQRSIFAFLNSAEPFGFQDFLKKAVLGDIYQPHMLWDYLRANLEPAILASPDGHRWALAAEALERCEALGGDKLHIEFLKTIALVDLFKERSGLVPSEALLQASFPDVKPRERAATIQQLSAWSLIVYKKFLSAYAIYAGSDFDIEQAVKEALDAREDIDFETLKTLAGLQPILAKRHYHDTGTLRWFDVSLAPIDALSLTAATPPAAGAIGKFILALPTAGETQEQAASACSAAVKASQGWDTIIGLSPKSWGVVSLAKELLALEAVRHGRPELQGDAVARREVQARLSVLQSQLEAEFHAAFDTANWYRSGSKTPAPFRHAELNILASDLAATRYPAAPVIHNELLNRQKPSSNAIAAQNELLRRMVIEEGKLRLGIDGFPAEGGLFASLLEATGLYGEHLGRHVFAAPGELAPDHAKLRPLWDAALEHLEKQAERTVSLTEIYDLWRAEPFGVKDGLMPLLITSLLLAERARLAAYRDGIFRPQLDDVDIQYLSKDARTIQLRWMDLKAVSRVLLDSLSSVVTRIDPRRAVDTASPVDVARALVSLYDELPPWTKRTSRLSPNALRIRDLLKRASDPNKFLFSDLPEAVGIQAKALNKKSASDIAIRIEDGFIELKAAYPQALAKLRQTFCDELQGDAQSLPGLQQIRERAENIRQVGGDFRLEALIGRLSAFDGSDPAFEEIASLAATKPPRDWVDLDLDRAAIELADLAQKFVRAETFARVKGRTQNREALAVVLGFGSSPRPMLEEFNVAEADRKAIEDVIVRVQAALENSDATRRNIILAALAQVSAQYMSQPSSYQTAGKNQRKRRVGI